MILQLFSFFVWFSKMIFSKKIVVPPKTNRIVIVCLYWIRPRIVVHGEFRSGTPRKLESRRWRQRSVVNVSRIAITQMDTGLQVKNHPVHDSACEYIWISAVRDSCRVFVHVPCVRRSSLLSTIAFVHDRPAYNVGPNVVARTIMKFARSCASERGWWRISRNRYKDLNN